MAAIALIVGAGWIQSWRHNRAPFAAAAVDPQLVGLQIMTPTNASGTNVVAALKALGDPPQAASIYLPGRHRHWQYVVGRIDVRAQPAPSGSECALVVIDNRSGEVVNLISGDPEHGSSGGSRAGSASDGGMNNAGRKFAWLGALKNVNLTDGETAHPGMGVYFLAGPARTLPFVAVLPSNTLPVTNVHSDLTVALLMLGSDDQPYWAKRLN